MVWSDRLRALDACTEGAEFADGRPNARAAWNACPRSDWLFWFLARDAKTLEARRRIVEIAGRVVRVSFDALHVGGVASAFVEILDRCDRLVASAADLRHLEALMERDQARGDTARAAVAAAVASVVRLAQTAERAGSDDRLLGKWTKAATRPSGFIALAHSNATFLRTGDKYMARAAADDALRESAVLVRLLVPADAVPVALYDVP